MYLMVDIWWGSIFPIFTQLGNWNWCFRFSHILPIKRKLDRSFSKISKAFYKAVFLFATNGN